MKTKILIDRLENYRKNLCLYVRRFNLVSVPAEAARVEEALFLLYTKLDKERK